MGMDTVLLRQAPFGMTIWGLWTDRRTTRDGGGCLEQGQSNVRAQKQSLKGSQRVESGRLVGIRIIIFFVYRLWRQGMEEENQEERQAEIVHDQQGYSLLERAVRLLRKNTSFPFYDQIRRQGTIRGLPHREIEIQVGPATLEESRPVKNEHALKIFWRCLCNRHFRPLQESDLQVLMYLKLLVHSPVKEGNHFYSKLQVARLKSYRYFYPYNSDPQYLHFSQQSYSAIKATLKQPLATSHLETLDYSNLLQYIYLEHLSIVGSKTDKKLHNRLKRLRRDKYNLTPKLKNKTQQAYLGDLQKERRELRELRQQFPCVSYPETDDQLSLQLGQLEVLLGQVNASNRQLAGRIILKVNEQIISKDRIYVISTQDQTRQSNVLMPGTNQTLRMSMLDRVSLQKRYLQYTILQLEQKQIAQSIAKISRNKSSMFQVVFEKGSCLSPKNYSLKEMLDLQKMRELPLLRYYNSSLKTKYYSMSYLVSGFQQLFNKKSVQQFKNKNLLLEKQLPQPTDPAKKNFENFDICHHCKQLYDNIYLVKCNYHSSTMGPPTQNLSYIDPYIQQIVQRQTLSTTRAFYNNKKNPFMTYHKKGSEYVCHRKYCRLCLRQSYDSIEKNGLCPFCHGVCYCSRCLRNDNIIKLKSMFALMGGDVVALNLRSELYNLVPSTEQTPNRLANKSIGGGTLKKGARVPEESLQVQKVTYRGYLRLGELREQMQECRQICQLVKRRQKHKLFWVENQQKIFLHTANDLDLDFKVGKRPRSSENGSTEVQTVRKIKRTK